MEIKRDDKRKGEKKQQQHNSKRLGMKAAGGKDR